MPAKTIEFTVTITAPQGNRIAGQSTGSARAETLIGAISPSYKSGMILDDDGQYLFTIRDIDTLDVCYSHSKPNDKAVSWLRVKVGQIRTVSGG